ncbi:MAG: hypothetical protein JRI23_16570, partial [Deltaproteobacteria bacterium]|nr:hypothetical protein [Deltaproteobacteria bacterium]MBW2533391.1 hypothetical protein [Deltaproteobacteria bacterium]
MTAFGRSNVWIADAGLVSPLGRTVLQAALGARAGLHLPRPTPFDDVGSAPATCRVWDLPADCVGFERLARLIEAAACQVELPDWQTPLPVMLITPEGMPADEGQAGPQEVFDALVATLGVSADGQRSTAIRGNHADGARLFQQAARLVEAGDVPGAIVAAADSYYHPDVLRALRPTGEGQRRSVGLRFTPSEAGAVVLLAARSELDRLPHSDEGRLQALARLCTVAADRIGEETLTAMTAERGRVAEARARRRAQRQRAAAEPRSFPAGMRPARITAGQARARLRRAMARS